MAGKNVSLSIGLDDRSEIVNGSSTPKDLVTLMQLLYLSFTDQHKDPEAVEAWKSKIKDMLKSQRQSSCSFQRFSQCSSI